MQVVDIKSFSEYFEFLKGDLEGMCEWKEFLELLLNTETSFFRHIPSFQTLTQQLLPDLLHTKQESGDRMIALWSAGCSTGQEAYSLAMVLFEAVAGDATRSGRPATIRGRKLGKQRPQNIEDAPDTRDLLLPKENQITVLGSDIHERSLDKAKRGHYKPSEVRTMPASYRHKYLDRIASEKGAFYRVVKRVKNLVSFIYLNLHDPDNYSIPSQDVIFCQNVLIYFKPESRGEILHRLCERLNLGGYLVFAPAEVLGTKLPGMHKLPIRNSLIYERVE
jgi:chemotaxis methyl-accepting protein methylase